jgi:hypothetical protein
MGESEPAEQSTDRQASRSQEKRRFNDHEKKSQKRYKKSKSESQKQSTFYQETNCDKMNTIAQELKTKEHKRATPPAGGEPHRRTVLAPQSIKLVESIEQSWNAEINQAYTLVLVPSRKVHSAKFLPL